MEEADAAATDGGDEGVAAVLYGMFTSFTEALDGLDRRLGSMEVALGRLAGKGGEGGAPGGELAGGREAAAVALADHQAVGEGVRARIEAVEGRLGGLEGAVAEVATSLAGRAQGLEARVAALAEGLEARLAALAEAVEDLRRLLAAHAQETSHSLGRRAGDAGRRLVSDLGRRARQGPGGSPPP